MSFLQDLMPLLACCTVEARHYGLVRLVRAPSRGLDVDVLALDSRHGLLGHTASCATWLLG